MTAAQTRVENSAGLQETGRKPWLNVASHLHPKFGGIAGILPEYLRAVSGTGECPVSLLSVCDPSEAKAFRNPGSIPVKVLEPGKWKYAFDRQWRQEIHNTVAGAEGVHIHGIWEEHCLAAAHAARTLRRPYIVSAHGMLEPWALRNKRLKKIVYSALIEHRNVRKATCLHALTLAEAENYRRFGARTPIAVIPNGVDVPSDSSPAEFFRQYPNLKGQRLVLFLGRIHYKKGLDLLIRSWHEISRNHQDAHLVLAGPDAENSQAAVEELIGSCGIADRVTFTGMLTGSLKWSALAAASVFILPSYSEGLSVSVLEALATAKPVIITRQCNMPEVAEFECGWVVEPEVSEVTSALSECLGATPQELAQLGSNAAGLIRKRFSWDIVGAQMASVYRWLAGGPVPRSVNLLLP